VRCDKSKTLDVGTEPSVSMVVLSVHVCSDCTADGNLPGAGRHGHEPPARDDEAEHGVERDASFDAEQPSIEVGLDDPIERRAVEEDSARALGSVSVGAAESSGKDRC
jgi:hypothetical protein